MTPTTPYKHGWNDGYRGRQYGWSNDDDWRDQEHDEYETGYTSGTDARYYAPEAIENYERDA